MADRVKGINIQLGGDITGLSKALQGINKEISQTGTKLKDVNRLLKLDPKNTTLLAQKQGLLKDKINATETKLKSLKEADKQAKAQLDSGDLGKDKYDSLQREIIATESELKKMKAEAASANLANVSTGMNDVGNSMKSAGKAMLPVTAAVAAVGTASVKATADFDTAMAQVAATKGTTVDNITDLREAAQEAGEQTAWSASEAAEALNYLSLAGLDSASAAGNLNATLNLASAGSMELGDASDMLTDAMTALGIEMDENGENATAFGDKMATTASKSNTSVEQLGEGILKVGGTAKNMAGGTTELNAALGILADNSIKGEEGGTHLRNMLLALNPTTEKAKNAWKELGVSAYDTDGNLRPLQDTFADLNKAMEGMTDEEKTSYLQKMFNKTDLSSVNAMLATSSDRWNELSSAIDGSDGAMQDMADTQLDNLNGQLTLLKSALEGAAISIGGELMPYIQALTEKVQGAVEWFNSLSESQKALVVKIALVVAAIGPVLSIVGSIIGALSTAVGIVSTFLGALAAGEGVIGALGVAFGVALGPVLAIIAAISAVIAVGVLLYKNWDKIKTVANNVATAVQKAFKGMLSSVRSIFNSIRSVASKVWKAIKTVITAAVNGIKNKVSSVFNSMKSKISSVFNGIKAKAKSAFNAVKTAILTPLNAAKKKVTSTLSSMKEKFTSFKSAVSKSFNFLSGLKVPKITISGGKLPYGIGGAGVKPSISVKWNKKAMNNPFMFSGATLFGAGEAGDEVLYGRRSLMNDIKSAVGGGGTNVVMNMTVNGADNPEQWGRVMAAEFRRKVRMA